MACLLPLSIPFMTGTGWGTAIILVKYATQRGIHPLAYVFWVALGVRSRSC